ncbi:MAG: hypothetical protein ACYCWW_21215, partial [Deltaproteobacteria bacterium]
LRLDGLRLLDLADIAGFLPPALAKGRPSGELDATGLFEGAAGGRWDGQLMVSSQRLSYRIGAMPLSGQLNGVLALAGRAPPFDGTAPLDGLGVGGVISLQGRAMAHPAGMAASSVQATLDGRLDERPIAHLTTTALLAALDAKVRAEGRVGDLALGDLWLETGTWGAAKRRVSLSGDATVSLSAELSGGRLTPGSTATLRSERFGLGWGSLELAGSALATARIARGGATGRLELNGSAAHFDLLGQALPLPLVHGDNATAVLSMPLPHALAGAWPSDWKGELDLGEMRIPDLAEVATYLPETKQLRITGGKGRLVAKLSRLSDGERTETVRLSAKRTQLEIGGKPVTFDWGLLVDLAHADPASPSLDLRGSELSIEHADVSSLGESRDWWGQFEVDRGWLRLGERRFFTGSLSAHARDLLPLLDLYGTRLGIPVFLHEALAFEGFDATGRLTLGPTFIRIDPFHAQGQLLDASGRLLLFGPEKRGQLLLTSGPFAIGADVEGAKTHLELLGATSWYAAAIQSPL